MIDVFELRRISVEAELKKQSAAWEIERVEKKLVEAAENALKALSVCLKEHQKEVVRHFQKKGLEVSHIGKELYNFKFRNE